MFSASARPPPCATCGCTCSTRAGLKRKRDAAAASGGAVDLIGEDEPSAQVPRKEIHIPHSVIEQHRSLRTDAFQMQYIAEREGLHTENSWIGSYKDRVFEKEGAPTHLHVKCYIDRTKDVYSERIPFVYPCFRMTLQVKWNRADAFLWANGGRVLVEQHLPSALTDLVGTYMPSSTNPVAAQVEKHLPLYLANLVASYAGEVLEFRDGYAVEGKKEDE